ncbi:aldo/keto reductase [Actinoplanes sp. NPDC051411]|uniref:aldo/keto reductase n=1 Tax=Actinoplanes sp. NPDC051411 TaxID=3155522 RepID=UPI0034352701
MTWIASTTLARRAQFGRFLLGAGNIGGSGSAVGPGIGLSDTEGFGLIDRAVEEGFKILDTADFYTRGNSERVIGLWNKGHPDSDLLIQTKTGVTANGPDLSPGRVERQLRRSVETLGRVDLYLAHTVDPKTPWSGTLAVLGGAVQDGRIRAYGLSNVDEAALTSALDTADRLGLPRPELIQNGYSLLVRSDDEAVLPIVESEGLAYTPYSPLANGILAGRYSKGEKPAEGSRASTGPRAKGLLDDPTAMKRVKQFDEIAAEQGVSSACLALAWVINRPVMTAPIIGISRDSQWRNVREATEFPWTEEIAARLDELFPAK